MKTIATVRQNDAADGPLIQLGYDTYEDTNENGHITYIGVASDNGDDYIFTTAEKPDEIIMNIQRRWSKWNTYSEVKPHLVCRTGKYGQKIYDIEGAF